MAILGLLVFILWVVVIAGTVKSVQAGALDTIWYLSWLKDVERWGWTVGFGVAVVGSVVASLLYGVAPFLGYAFIVLADAYFGYRLVKFLKG